MTRITNCFKKIKNEKRKALVVFITAGDPDLEETKSILDVIDDSGADIIKVGIGAGSSCTTRIIAGVGVPQLTAVLDCAEIGKQYDIPIISDGGTRTSGDATKALAAGASSVMLDSLKKNTKFLKIIGSYPLAELS